ncbi:MAG: DUF2213 domain-containing protein [Burkholderiales bacterium]
MNYFFTSFQSGKQAQTPEGYLVCYDVPIARAGVMEYTFDELGLEAPVANLNGMVSVDRSIADIHDPIALMSFEGKPLTIGHPSVVSPQNWKEHADGIVQNVRASLNGFVIADLLVTDAIAINAVQSGALREVSCGYDAELVKVGDGYKQKNIRGNHVALVEAGRCGPECAIQDKHSEVRMPAKMKDDLNLKISTPPETPTQAPVAAPVQAAPVAGTDQGYPEEEKKMDQDPMAEMMAMVQQIEARLTALEAMAKGEPMQEAVSVQNVKPMDAEPLTISAEIKAAAEIVAPGLRSKTLIKDALDCACRNLDHRGIVQSIIGDRSIEDVDQELVLKAVAALVKVKREAANRITYGDMTALHHGPMTPEALNKLHADHWRGGKVA